MGLLKKIRYGIKRFLQGEEGIVESVEENVFGNLPRDDFNGIPQRVIIKNPLGERIKSYSSMGLVLVGGEDGFPKAIKKYKTYSPGERYP